MSFDAGPDYEQSLFSSKICGEKRKTSTRASVSVSVTSERRCPRPRVARAWEQVFIRAL